MQINLKKNGCCSACRYFSSVAKLSVKFLRMVTILFSAIQLVSALMHGDSRQASLKNF